VYGRIELEVSDHVVGPDGGEHGFQRTAKRRGHEECSMTIGGGRALGCGRGGVERELPSKTDEHFADRDPLTRGVIDRMLAGSQWRALARVADRRRGSDDPDFRWRAVSGAQRVAASETRSWQLVQ
jgi:putative transposase